MLKQCFLHLISFKTLNKFSHPLNKTKSGSVREFVLYKKVLYDLENQVWTLLLHPKTTLSKLQIDRILK